MKGKIIFLNGVTSCGKTTIAELMIEMCNSVTLHFSNDLFHNIVSYSLYDSFWKFVADTITAQYYSAAGAVTGGYNVIIDGMLLDLPEYIELTGKRNLELVDELFADTEYTLIDLVCPPDELRRRNISRGDRRADQSDEQLSFMSKNYKADSIINVMAVQPDEAAAQILELCSLPIHRTSSLDDNICKFRKHFFEDVLKEFSVKVDSIIINNGVITSELEVKSPRQAQLELEKRGYSTDKNGCSVRYDKNGSITETVQYINN